MSADNKRFHHSPANTESGKAATYTRAAAAAVLTLGTGAALVAIGRDLITPIEPIQVVTTPQPRKDLKAEVSPTIQRERDVNPELFGLPVVRDSNSHKLQIVDQATYRANPERFVDSDVSLWSLATFPDPNRSNSFVSVPSLASDYKPQSKFTLVGYNQPTAEGVSRTVADDHASPSPVSHGILVYGDSYEFRDIFDKKMVESDETFIGPDGKTYRGGLWRLLTDEHGNPIDQFKRGGRETYTPALLADAFQRGLLSDQTMRAGYNSSITFQGVTPQGNMEFEIAENRTVIPVQFVAWGMNIFTEINNAPFHAYATIGDEIMTHTAADVTTSQIAYAAEKFSDEVAIAPALGGFYSTLPGGWSPDEIRVYNHDRTAYNTGALWGILVNKNDGRLVKPNGKDSDSPLFVLTINFERLQSPSQTPSPRGKGIRWSRK